MIRQGQIRVLVAFANRRDIHLPWAYALARCLREPLLTCEAVLAETAFHLRDSALVMRFLDTGLVRIAFDIEGNRGSLCKLAGRYADRNPDLADLCLIRMSELNPELSIFTVDGDFRIYRRNGRATIPVVMPPDGR